MEITAMFVLGPVLVLSAIGPSVPPSLEFMKECPVNSEK